MEGNSNKMGALNPNTLLWYCFRNSGRTSCPDVLQSKGREVLPPADLAGHWAEALAGTEQPLSVEELQSWGQLGEHLLVLVFPEDRVVRKRRAKFSKRLFSS